MFNLIKKEGMPFYTLPLIPYNLYLTQTFENTWNCFHSNTNFEITKTLPIQFQLSNSIYTVPTVYAMGCEGSETIYYLVKTFQKELKKQFPPGKFNCVCRRPYTLEFDKETNRAVISCRCTFIPKKNAKSKRIRTNTH